MLSAAAWVAASVAGDVGSPLRLAAPSPRTWTVLCACRVPDTVAVFTTVAAATDGDARLRLPAVPVT